MPGSRITWKKLNSLNNLNDKSDKEEIIMAKIYIVTDMDTDPMLDGIFAAPPRIFTDKKAAEADFYEAVEAACEAIAERELGWEVDKNSDEFKTKVEMIECCAGFSADSGNCLKSFQCEGTFIMLQEAYWEPETN